MGLYIGENNNKAKIIKQLYVGDEKGIARLVKKAYVGVDGIAKLFWGGNESGEEFTGARYYGTVSAMARGGATITANNKNYAIFAGGNFSGTDLDNVEAYDNNLIRYMPDNLSRKVKQGIGASTGDYAIIAGGWFGTNFGYNSNINAVNAYSSSLVHSTLANLGTARAFLGGVSLGGYAIFAGGTNYNAFQTATDCYNNNLSKVSISALSYGRKVLTGASNSNYAFFAGGWRGTAQSVVEAYDINLTKKTVTSISSGRCYIAGASTKDYAIFGGGSSVEWATEGTSNVVEAYDKNLVKTSLTKLNNPAAQKYTSSLNGYTLFVGGVLNPTTTLDDVELYDSNLVKTTLEPMPYKMSSSVGQATTVGNYVLIAPKADIEAIPVFEVK